MPSIIIGGDVCPRGPNEPLFKQGRADAIFGDLLPEFGRADIRVVNLECPLVADLTPIRKVGLALGVSKDCVNGLRAAGIGAVNLANNHILDQGEAGLRSTIDACAAAGIGCFGAGSNLAQAGRVFVREVNGIRIGFYGVVDRWPCLAGVDSWGANPIDALDVAKSFRKELPALDFLVVLVHAGSEHFQYPSPGLQRLCRFLIEEGAGAVICQHSHCAGCYEFYDGVPIVYGQGNLIFHWSGDSATWYEGFLVRLDIRGRRDCSAEWVKEFLDELSGRAREIQADGVVGRKWAELCEKRRRGYEGAMYHSSNWLPSTLTRLHLDKWLYSDESRALVRLFIQCETHRELLLKILGDEAERAGYRR
jgi:hypothetical protein